jgi:hypothetical protein
MGASSADLTRLTRDTLAALMLAAAGLDAGRDVGADLLELRRVLVTLARAEGAEVPARSVPYLDDASPEAVRAAGARCAWRLLSALPAGRYADALDAADGLEWCAARWPKP